MRPPCPAPSSLLSHEASGTSQLTPKRQGCRPAHEQTDLYLTSPPEGVGPCSRTSRAEPAACWGLAVFSGQSVLPGVLCGACVWCRDRPGAGAGLLLLSERSLCSWPLRGGLPFWPGRGPLHLYGQVCVGGTGGSNILSLEGLPPREDGWAPGGHVRPPNAWTLGPRPCSGPVFPPCGLRQVTEPLCATSSHL